MRRNPTGLGRFGRFGWDAPPDVVPTAIGVLAVLAGVLACVGALNALRPGPAIAPAPAIQPAPPAATSLAYTLKVPWFRASSKTPVFAALSGGRVRLLDLRPVYAALSRQAAPAHPEPLDFELADGTVRFFPVTNEVYCFQVRPGPEADGNGAVRKGAVQEGAVENGAVTNSAITNSIVATQPDDEWQRARRRYPATRFYYFFWVAGDSFEAFRSLRESLRRDGVEVRWKPLREGAPLEVCQGVDGAAGLEPQ